MLQLRRNVLFLGQVYCLHRPGAPEPDLNSDENPWVIPLEGGSRTVYLTCDRNGVIHKSLSDSPRGGVKIYGVDPYPEVMFIPAVQLSWEQVNDRDEEKKYAAYSPRGVMLVRATGLMVRVYYRDGSPSEVKNERVVLTYTPSRRRFSSLYLRINEEPLSILEEFADRQGCSVASIVFCPIG